MDVTHPHRRRAVLVCPGPDPDEVTETPRSDGIMLDEVVVVAARRTLTGVGEDR